MRSRTNRTKWISEIATGCVWLHLRDSQKCFIKTSSPDQRKKTVLTSPWHEGHLLRTRLLLSCSDIAYVAWCGSSWLSVAQLVQKLPTTGTSLNY
mmetsp:Transcript_7834/g.23664  ORF Transcript_7834/g.23664 Transcript_7834/m.23664 type:complete len:95 (+) Transcript_7834:1508-1792(+)